MSLLVLLGISRQPAFEVDLLVVIFVAILMAQSRRDDLARVGLAAESGRKFGNHLCQEVLRDFRDSLACVRLPRAGGGRCASNAFVRG